MTNDVVKYQETLVWSNLRLLLVHNLKTDVVLTFYQLFTQPQPRQQQAIKI